MVTGSGGLRPHWRSLLGTYSALGPGGLADRARRLDRAVEAEGTGSILPGAEGGWRCDAVPLLLSADEFSEIEAGLAQRATLLEALLADIYGKQTLLAEGLLPPALVYANPCWLRPSHSEGFTRPARYLDCYAADLIRAPDGHWHVLGDRTELGAGAGYTLENRRVFSSVMPEAFRGLQVRPLSPFFDAWSNALSQSSPAGGQGASAVALLTPGSRSPHWFEHLLLARALSCALVEAGDLTIRGGVLFLKTLRGLQRVDVLLRRQEGRLLDPLEMDTGDASGITGLMDAVRGGNVRVSNDPGAGAAGAPAISGFLPLICERLLGEPLAMPAVPGVWLGDPAAYERVMREPAQWMIRPALDGDSPPVPVGSGIEAKPWAYCAVAAYPASLAPSAGKAGLEPKPVVLRMFLVFDGARWVALEGGFARVADAPVAVAGHLPRAGLCKDVWVMSGDIEERAGHKLVSVPPLPIRRTAGDMPSRVADNLYWLGRYVERLETAARLTRAVLQRVTRDTLLPHEFAELQVLARCLRDVRVVNGEAMPASGSVRPLTDALFAAVRETGEIFLMFTEVAYLTETVRDRLTSEMYGVFTQSLRDVRADAQNARLSMDQLGATMTSIIRFSALVAGMAAESMVRGGGWLFLELGRRVERAMNIASMIADAMDVPPPRVDASLRLVLDLCDSAITYRSRYLTVLQPALVLDLVLADEGNPRGMAFQLAAIRRLLSEIASRTDSALLVSAGQLMDAANAMVARVAGSPEQATEAARVAAPLRALGRDVMALSDRISRRYFALLPAARTVGVEVTGDTDMRGAA